MELCDSHAHLYWHRFDEDRASVIEAAKNAGVSRIVVPGTNLETSRAAETLSREHVGLSFTAGLHPSDSASADPETRAAIKALCQSPGSVGVGEAGLDFFHDHYPPADVQETCFRWQLALAVELDKPIVIHCRDAHTETLACVRDFPGVRGVLHCFTMGTEEMQAYVDCGLHISYSGVVTFPKNEANRAAAAATPLDRLLIETDSPFLAPQAERGKRNEPAFVAHVLASVASARSADPKEIAAATTANAKALFGLGA